MRIIIKINNKEYYKLARQVIYATIRYEKLDYNFSVNIDIINKNKIKELNKDLRGIDKITDVLSFPNIDYNDVLKHRNIISIYDYDTKTIFLGDIVICKEKVIEQAKMYGHSIKREFAFLVCHSMLHLLGYDHIKKNDEKIMFDTQNKILEILKIYR